MAKAITAITPKTAYPIIAAFNPATPKYLFEKYAKDNELTYAEASKYLTSDEFKIWRTDIKGYLEMIEDNPEVLLEPIVLILCVPGNKGISQK